MPCRHAHAHAHLHGVHKRKGRGLFGFAKGLLSGGAKHLLNAGKKLILPHVHDLAHKAIQTVGDKLGVDQGLIDTVKNGASGAINHLNNKVDQHLGGEGIHGYGVNHAHAHRHWHAIAKNTLQGIHRGHICPKKECIKDHIVQHHMRHGKGIVGQLLGGLTGLLPF